MHTHTECFGKGIVIHWSSGILLKSKTIGLREIDNTKQIWGEVGVNTQVKPWGVD